MAGLGIKYYVLCIREAIPAKISFCLEKVQMALTPVHCIFGILGGTFFLNLISDKLKFLKMFGTSSGKAAGVVWINLP